MDWGLPALSVSFTKRCCLQELVLGSNSEKAALLGLVPSIHVFDRCSESQFWKRQTSGLEGASVIVLDLRLRGGSTAKGFAETLCVTQADVSSFDTAGVVSRCR